ncbi:MAG: hypothetical protein JW726_15895, partial [Anaerolineales bacterium]|nr:hypothetical protein [Anaerolineales bacterium]
MNKPWMIALLSLIPGLGFWVLGQRRRAVGMFILFGAIAFMFYLFVRETVWKPLVDFSSYIFWFVWIGQGVFAMDTANLVHGAKLRNSLFRDEFCTNQNLSKFSRTL